MSSNIKKPNTNCVSCNVLLKDKKLVENRNKRIKFLIIIRIKNKETKN